MLHTNVYRNCKNMFEYQRQISSTFKLGSDYFLIVKTGKSDWLPFIFGVTDDPRVKNCF